MGDGSSNFSDELGIRECGSLVYNIYIYIVSHKLCGRCFVCSIDFLLKESYVAFLSTRKLVLFRITYSFSLLFKSDFITNDPFQLLLPSEMNIIMSGALPNQYLYRGTSDFRKPQSCVAPTSPQSPLDFIERIPFNEVKVSKEALGSGSFGTVFKGRWHGRLVAVKQYKTREERNSFLVEVKQLSCVKHQNIVTLYGAITLPDTAYLIMEYAEGGSLNNLLHESNVQTYDLRHACSWAMQTARGVAYLHSITPKPIMHRDLKPANLLLFSRGQILKICDFGTACDVKTQMTNNTGSPSYMAPEVFSTSSYLESGDVFSWSIIFWEILVRLHPYDQPYSNPFQILWSVNQGARPAVIEYCPKHIWNLITKSWDKDPKKRPSMKFIADEMACINALVNGKYLTPDSPERPRHQEDGASHDWALTSSTESATSSSSHPETPFNQQVYREPSQPRISIKMRQALLKRRIIASQALVAQLERMKCDQKDKDVSFYEFEELKDHVKSIRHHVSTGRSRST
jgi:serine/threonine protein kinase